MVTAVIDPRQIRPSRGWYPLAFLVPVLGMIAGVVAFALSFSSAANTVPELILRSDSGASSSAQLIAGRLYQIYVPQDAVATATCTLAPKAATLTPALDDAAARDLESFTSGGVAWQPRYEVEVTTTGRSTISCGGTKFAVGDEDKTDAARANRFLDGAIGFTGLPCAGLTIGVVIGIVVAVRRSGSRKRLQQAALQHGPRWAPDAYPPPGYQQPGQYQQPY